MASVIHIAEVAAILTVAYVFGWLIGYAAHRLLARAPAAIPEVPAERIAAVTAPPAAAALVKAPVIDPVPRTPLPGGPAPEPAAVAEAVAAAEAAIVPPRSEPAPAGPVPASTPLAPVEIPAVEAPPPMRVEPIPERPAPADPEAPRPAAGTEPELALTASPASKPGEAWTGEIRGRAATPLAPMEEAAVPAAPAEAMAAEAPAGPVAPPPAGPSPSETPLTIDLGPLGPDSIYGEPIVPQPAAEPVPPPAADLSHEAPPAESAPPVPVDEDAAMRAIEGGWSRVHARALPDSPELSDVGAAVAAAQSAVDQVLAKAGIDAETSRQSARPKGLPRPRNGRKDDLTRIDGLGPLDESTLNNLGVFHFDQIAGWNEAQVLWMENHVFARGRIGTEKWQQQARDLAATVTG